MVHYRIPAVCNVKLTRGGKTLFESRIPVYQLGIESLISARCRIQPGHRPVITGRPDPQDSPFPDRLKRIRIFLYVTAREQNQAQQQENPMDFAGPQLYQGFTAFFRQTLSTSPVYWMCR